MKRFPKMLLIGGATRNVGKTHFSTSVIRRFSNHYPIIGLKVKSIYPNDTFFHGKDRSPLKGNYRITEETKTNSGEDTARMLLAGAQQVFKLKVKAEFIEEALADLFSRIPTDVFFVCESNSLRFALEPDLFLMIKHQSSDQMKPSAKKLEPLADKIILTNGEQHDYTATDIEIKDGVWLIKSVELKSYK